MLRLQLAPWIVLITVEEGIIDGFVWHHTSLAHRMLRFALACRQAVEYPCDVCNVVAASEGDLAAHLDGKRHRKHVQMAEVLADSKSPAAPAPAAEPIELHCELCDVTAPTQTHKELHLM